MAPVEGGRPRGPSGQRAQLPEGGRERKPTRECTPALCNGSEMALPVRLSSGGNSRASTASGKTRKLTIGSSRKTSSSPNRRQTIEPPFATFDPADDKEEESTQSLRLTVQEEVMQQNRAALLDYLRYGAVRFKSAQQEADYQDYTRRIDAARWVLYLRRFFALFCVGFVIFIVYDGAPPHPRVVSRHSPPEQQQHARLPASPVLTRPTLPCRHDSRQRLARSRPRRGSVPHAQLRVADMPPARRDHGRVHSAVCAPRRGGGAAFAGPRARVVHADRPRHRIRRRLPEASVRRLPRRG